MQHAIHKQSLSVGGLKKNLACKPWTQPNWMSQKFTLRRINISPPVWYFWVDNFPCPKMGYPGLLQFIRFGVFDQQVSCFISVWGRLFMLRLSQQHLFQLMMGRFPHTLIWDLSKHTWTHTQETFVLAMNLWAFCWYIYIYISIHTLSLSIAMSYWATPKNSLPSHSLRLDSKRLSIVIYDTHKLSFSNRVLVLHLQYSSTMLYSSISKIQTYFCRSCLFLFRWRQSGVWSCASKHAPQSL